MIKLTEAISKQQIGLLFFIIWHTVKPVPIYEVTGG